MPENQTITHLRKLGFLPNYLNLPIVFSSESRKRKPEMFKTVIKTRF